MQRKTFNNLLLFSLFFMAYWFFGNLYEQIVLVPNHLVDSYETMNAYQDYFKLSNPFYYFVPFTQLAVFVVWFLYFKTNNLTQKKLLKKASFFGLLSLAITAVIVTQINLSLFSGDLDKLKDELYGLSVMWLIGNAIRLYFVGSALHYLLKAYVLQHGLKGERST